MELIHYHFDQLSLQQMYDIMVLRQEVFVVEQDCPFLDADGLDQKSYHIVAYESGVLALYARIVPPDLAYKGYCSIGRVVTKKNHRNKGWGLLLMEYSIELVRGLWKKDIKISAQVYAIPFYEKCNFVSIGEPYLEDDIWHQAMVLVF